ncbi:glutamate synthase large subunit [Nocardioides zeae]|uniref:Glutamate synthase large subunit n=1 Tax=Nocardioides imazamoxiresistens TaxID=3231893 RepID=A0ABU3PZG7_9ACTN|nr:glutamate synthase large subunit [Nocardioides zeae]MDT9594539.1 glutamate synthase large subunit [Nocardioides zeae]
MPISHAIPEAQGLYDPRFEHDACGVAFVATMTGVASHDIVAKALQALRNLDHRGAAGAEPNSGDGAGILLQVPDAFLRAVAGVELPEAGRYAVGVGFLPADADDLAKTRTKIEEIAAQEGVRVLGWRDVPVAPEVLGSMALSVMPTFSQLFLAPVDESVTGMDLERLAFCVRKRAEREAEAYFPSLSSRTLVYKGMLTTDQLDHFFPDLRDERMASAIGVVHSRFSTNTFPSWPLAHPFRFIAHNGEINTVMGNRNWMRAREALLASDVIPGDLDRLFPICTPGASDSASFDEVLELLHLGGRSLPHSVLMMIPEAWENHGEMDDAKRAFYEFHASTMEAWDGPACVVFTDGAQIGATLDRNGLRPSRFWVTDDGLVVLASEVGVLDIDPATIVRKGRLQPGKMFLVDLEEHRIVEDEEIKAGLAAEQPYAEWLAGGLLHLKDVPEREHIVHTHASVTRRQQIFGYTEEELRVLLTPMANAGAEPIGSMGTDTPIAALSEKPRLLFDYFAQLFAQVTNPPLDAIREELVTSLNGSIGPESNLLAPGPDSCRQIVLPFPVIDNDELAKIRHINRDGEHPGFVTHVARGLYEVEGGGASMAQRIAEICAEVSAAIADGARIIVLSDRHSTRELAPIPSLLLTGAVHHHLVREKTRTQVGLLVEAGDVREVHHVALLVGYGAAAVNPYLAMESVEDLARAGYYVTADPQVAVRNLVKALGKGVLKVMSKIGVSTVASYTGAQIFEAVGLSQELVDAYFTGTTSKLGGIGIETVAEEVARRHATAYPPSGVAPSHRELSIGGEYQWRREGEPHLFDPETVFRLQHSTRAGRFDVFQQYTQRVDEQSERLMTLRGLFRLRSAEDAGRTPVPLEEVEPVEAIVKRFSTGAMSYGSISQEAHETLAIAMNRLGAKSNTGEGGEDPERLHDPERRSSIKQVASGRFGVTSEYLTNADDIQIKMAQGAKPGEGGQLPGHKVYPWVAKTRHSTPGVGLISPPPHHDIYSIEDLAQLIHDLKNANPAARIHVKLVSEVGVGTVATGVSKAHADVVLISGHDGGTGASPLTSLKHAGGPWELGLAEAQQTLLLNGLRDRIVVQADGQLKTGRDVVIAALLGAEEFGFATAPLVVSGCIMMRVCHLDTCPVGVATQNPVLRERFSGKAEYVVNFFTYIAQEVRQYLADLGFRSIDEAVGQVASLDVERAVDHWKASGLDLAPILHVPDNVMFPDQDLRCTGTQDHGLDKALDNELIAIAAPALENGEPVRAQVAVRNVNRTVGTMLGHEVTKRYRGEGLPEGTIDITFTGSAGQSFGAFVPRGVTLRLEGDGNDYVGKGLSGGRIAIRPDRSATFASQEQIIAGNTIAYGATSGEIFIRGGVGERCCVRNSGALVVTEGVGDHAAEYMTGGRLVVLGKTGRNFAAGMSGGIAWVLDLKPWRVNDELVDLRPVEGEAAEELHAYVRAFSEETGSEVAEQLLADWPAAVGRFTEVMPRDFKRVLDARAEAEAEGLDEDQTAARIMEVLHG